MRQIIEKDGVPKMRTTIISISLWASIVLIYAAFFWGVMGYGEPDSYIPALTIIAASIAGLATCCYALFFERDYAANNKKSFWTAFVLISIPVSVILLFITAILCGGFDGMRIAT